MAIQNFLNLDYKLKLSLQNGPTVSICIFAVGPFMLLWNPNYFGMVHLNIINQFYLHYYHWNLWQQHPLEQHLCVSFVAFWSFNKVYELETSQNTTNLTCRQQHSIMPHSGSRQSQLQVTIWEKETEVQGVQGVQGEKEETLHLTGGQQMNDSSVEL